MIKIQIKPLSANQLWQGKRYKTKKYNQYRQDMIRMLPSGRIPKGPLCIKIEVGLSNKQQDLDNVLKALIDNLQVKYRFNDSQIYRIEADKVIVKKGQEYIAFQVLLGKQEDKT